MAPHRFRLIRKKSKHVTVVPSTYIPYIAVVIIVVAVAIAVVVVVVLSCFVLFSLSKWFAGCSLLIPKVSPHGNKLLPTNPVINYFLIFLTLKYISAVLTLNHLLRTSQDFILKLSTHFHTTILCLFISPMHFFHWLLLFTYTSYLMQSSVDSLGRSSLTRRFEHSWLSS